MARLADRLPENADGELYVDRSCIDCAICRSVAAHSFARSERAGASFVVAQPSSDDEWHRAKMALVACPTSSIGSRSKLPLAEAIDAFPEPLGDDVWFCGFASPQSYGAQSYLVVRPEGNVLVDSPRVMPRLLERLEELGGVRWMFLTHRDDVADHEKIARHFGCTRIMHGADIGRDTRGVERILEGDAPTRLDHDLLAIPTPGHTRGSTSLLFRDLALFTGDHLFASEPRDGAVTLFAERSVCWYSWAEQTRSLERLRAFDFRWVLPGHDARLRTESAPSMRAHLEQAIAAARRER